jgi:hypothetical protein
MFPKLIASLFFWVKREAGEQDSDRRSHCHIATRATEAATKGGGRANLHNEVKVTGIAFRVKFQS